MIHRILTSGYNEEEQLYQIDEACRHGALSNDDRRLLTAAATELRGRQRATARHTTNNIASGRTTASTVLATFILPRDNLMGASGPAPLSDTALQNINYLSGIISLFDELLRASLENIIRPQGRYATPSAVVELIGNFLRSFSEEDLALISVSFPASYGHLQGLTLEYYRLRRIVERNRELFEPTRVAPTEHHLVVTSEETYPPRPLSAPPVSHSSSVHRPAGSIFPVSQLRSNLDTQPSAPSNMTTHIQQPPLAKTCPRALRRQRRNFFAMSSDTLVQARCARELAGLDISEMDEEIAFRMLRDFGF